MESSPITVKEALTLTSVGIDPKCINFNDLTMESERFICVREKKKSVAIIDLSLPSQVPRRLGYSVESALLDPLGKHLAIIGVHSFRTLDIYDIEEEETLKWSYRMPQRLKFWKWISPTVLGLAMTSSVNFWSAGKDGNVFYRANCNLSRDCIINHQFDSLKNWGFFISIAPGSHERPQLLKGEMQLFSSHDQDSQPIEAHAAALATLKLPGNDSHSTVFSFATKSMSSGMLVSELRLFELVGGPVNPPELRFIKKADLIFPPDSVDDFPVAMQISDKYNLIYVITKLGLLFVYGLETATIYMTRITVEPIFLTCYSPSTGGFYAITQSGQVLLATVNELTITHFLTKELAVNLPGAENQQGIIQRFQELFSQMEYKEAAELAADSPQGILRTKNTIAMFKNIQSGSFSPLLHYFEMMLTKGKLSANESLELSSLVLKQNKRTLLDKWFAEDKLEFSEELGDLLKTVDNEMALNVYMKVGAAPKVIATFVERGEFEKIRGYCNQVGYGGSSLRSEQKTVEKFRSTHPWTGPLKIVQSMLIPTI